LICAAHASGVPIAPSPDPLIKTKLMHGKQAVGNRFVVIRYPNEAAQMKAQTDGLKAWIEKNAPEARDIAAQAWEMK
jgi:hypothetical protein